MKAFTMVLILVIILNNSVFSQVGIGTSSPESSSVLDVTSSTKGILIPRMTQAERTAIPSPATGLVIYQTNGTSGLYFNSGTPASPVWSMVGYNAGQWKTNGSMIYYSDGNVGIGTSNPGKKLEVSGDDALIYGLTVGRGASYIVTNTVLGNHALFSNLTGNRSTAIGDSSLYYNTDGYYNTATGCMSLRSNTLGDWNTAFGYLSLYQNTEGNNNHGCGAGALYSNTTGSSNIGIGRAALYLNTDGFSNIAIGVRSLYRNTTKDNLVAIGDSALYNNGVGASGGSMATRNCAVGSKALYANTTGMSNTAVGFNALIDNTTGNNNTAVGSGTLITNSVGYGNTAVGSGSLSLNLVGQSNTGIGYGALENNTTHDNTAVGTSALHNNTSGINNTAIGFGSLLSNTTGANNVAVGGDAGILRTNIFAGTFIGYNTYTSIEDNYNITALGSNTHPTQSDQVQVGSSSVTSIGGYANWTNFSDGRYKKEITENVAGLDFILKLRPVTYHLDIAKLTADNGENMTQDENGSPAARTLSTQEIQSREYKAAITYTGLIAQEVESAAKSIGYDFSGVDVPRNEHGFYGLRYAELVVPLVKAVQEQQAIIQDLKKQNAEMLSRLEALEKK